MKPFIINFINIQKINLIQFKSWEEFISHLITEEYYIDLNKTGYKWFQRFTGFNKSKIIHYIQNNPSFFNEYYFTPNKLEKDVKSFIKSHHTERREKFIIDEVSMNNHNKSKLNIIPKFKTISISYIIEKNNDRILSFINNNFQHHDNITINITYTM